MSMTTSNESIDYLRTTTAEHAEGLVREAVYGSLDVLHQLAAAGKLTEDAHLVRRRIAESAGAIVRQAWREERAARAETRPALAGAR